MTQFIDSVSESQRFMKEIENAYVYTLGDFSVDNHRTLRTLAHPKLFRYEYGTRLMDASDVCGITLTNYLKTQSLGFVSDSPSCIF